MWFCCIEHQVWDTCRPGDGGTNTQLVELVSHWKAGHVRRLFDVELDNQHEEPLLLAQMAAQQLLQIGQPALLQAAGLQRIRSWATAVCQVVCHA